MVGADVVEANCDNVLAVVAEPALVPEPVPVEEPAVNINLVRLELPLNENAINLCSSLHNLLPSGKYPTSLIQTLFCGFWVHRYNTLHHSLYSQCIRIN
jgi:hypothetical protein